MEDLRGHGVYEKIEKSAICAVCFVEDPLLPITNLPSCSGSLDLDATPNDNDGRPLPLFVRIADADPLLRRYLFGRQRPGMRIERLSWYSRFLLMIILVRQLNARQETGPFYDLRVLTQLWCNIMGH
jgi:hypothetical protein